MEFLHSHLLLHYFKMTDYWPALTADSLSSSLVSLLLILYFFFQVNASCSSKVKALVWTAGLQHDGGSWIISPSPGESRRARAAVEGGRRATPR